MRNNYLCGSYTPLLRGVIHIFMCLLLIQYYSPYYFISFEAYIANIFILFGCIASIVYHNVYCPKYEVFFQNVDHLFVFIHMIAIYILVIKQTLIKYFILCIMTKIVMLASNSLFQNNDYIMSHDYMYKFAMLLLMIFVSGIYYSRIVFSVFLCALCLYVFAGLNYIYTRIYVDMSKIWSAHETFHLFQSLADILLIYHSLI